MYKKNDSYEQISFIMGTNVVFFLLMQINYLLFFHFSNLLAESNYIKKIRNQPHIR